MEARFCEQPTQIYADLLYTGRMNPNTGLWNNKEDVIVNGIKGLDIEDSGDVSVQVIQGADLTISYNVRGVVVGEDPGTARGKWQARIDWTDIDGFLHTVYGPTAEYVSGESVDFGMTADVQGCIRFRLYVWNIEQIGGTVHLDPADNAALIFGTPSSV